MKPSTADRSRCAARRISGVALLLPSARRDRRRRIFVRLRVLGCNEGNISCPKFSSYTDAVFAHATFSETMVFAQVRRQIPSGRRESTPREPSFALGRSGGIAHSDAMGSGSSAKVSGTSRRQRTRQQVAAVCYRIGRRGVEFLPVQTRGGRWIFPKGGVEPGLTLAQSAALEALEEAGVHGRIEEIPFARYFRRAPDAGISDAAVAAYLCEVTRREAPQEANRNPTWFSAEKAKERLRHDRAPHFGRELSRMVERACSRIELLQSHVAGSRSFEHKDELQKVRFDIWEAGRFHEGPKRAAFVRHVLHRHPALKAELRSVPVIGTKEIGCRVLRLGAGVDSSSEPVRNVTAIDDALAAGAAKLGNTPSAKHRNVRRINISWGHDSGAKR